MQQQSGRKRNGLLFQRYQRKRAITVFTQHGLSQAQGHDLQWPITSFVMSVTTKGSWQGLLSGKHGHIWKTCLISAHIPLGFVNGDDSTSGQDIVGSQSGYQSEQLQLQCKIPTALDMKCLTWPLNRDKTLNSDMKDIFTEHKKRQTLHNLIRIKIFKDNSVQIADKIHWVSCGQSTNRGRLPRAMCTSTLKTQIETRILFQKLKYKGFGLKEI